MTALPVERPYLSTAESDAAEQQWWDKNASLIAQVWQMHDEISNAARRWYLAQARKFFLGSQTRPVTVLELGCGSGWVGQAIAGPDVHIIGTDFSRNQIELARKNATARGLSDFTRYEIAAAEVWPTLDSEPDGVLIHAFLHHLSGKEMDGFLDMLRRHINPGTRLFVYEPAFYVSPTPPTTPRFLTPRYLRLGNWLVARLGEYYRKNRILDEATIATFSQLMRTATEAGQYLSPKEVPLDVDRFEGLLAKFADVRQNYWATIRAIGWCFETNLVTNDAVRRNMAKFALPFLMWLDRRVAADPEFLKTLLLPPDHAFHVWEAVAR